MDAKKIGLEEKSIKPVVDQLNELLANYHIHYQKVRGCHWNVKGGHFFTLHVKFEELYTNAQTTIDELAERILTLGKPPHSTFAEYIAQSKIKEINTVGVKDIDLVKAILGDFKTLIDIEREIMDTTADVGDDGTNDMINKFMQFKEKNTWMLRAFCGEN
ncbi:DNA starvation/stationary phase protection protein [Pedobacter sp. HMF7647]|uniref:DNA starvation/stationary phase protection protein n=1 Tax=Hufsiella arboris TaxID=2695275 RepID=A0A7K1Y8J0_9SPHI|nr:Dps family protein [Hufsiella arboris]MXV50691.1 DNA starvation/stationary phase protection protein [Hufsiella arboris]